MNQHFYDEADLFPTDEVKETLSLGNPLEKVILEMMVLSPLPDTQHVHCSKNCSDVADKMLQGDQNLKK
jgi:hypothetical protein